MRSLRDLCSEFFFKEQSCRAIALTRILLGLVLFALLILLYPDLDTWYGDGTDTIVSVATANACLPKFPTISFLQWQPSMSAMIHAIGVAAAVSLIVGWHARVSAALGFLVLQCFLRRNPFVVSGSDELLSQMLFYLIFSRAGDALSVSSFNRAPVTAVPWAQRLIQIQMSLLYGQTFLSKIGNADWLNGSALYSVLRTRELVHFPLPSFVVNSEFICRLLTWGALSIEFLLFTLIWFRPCRNWLILIGITFHLIMDYSLNIPMFQWVMIAGLFSFLDESLIEKLLLRFKLKKMVESPNQTAEGKI